MEKETIRKNYLDLRVNYDKNKIANYSDTISESFYKLYKEYDIFLLYISNKGEVDLSLLFGLLFESGKRVYLPVVTGDDLEFYLYEKSSQLKVDRFGIKVPITSNRFEIELEIERNSRIVVGVPGIAFGLDYNRIGYGKGYYDRYLRTKSLVRSVGIAYDFQLLDTLPADENDVKLNQIVTEIKII